MRSKLFVPASRPELFAKAFAGAADALSFDLEDAVVEARKSEAREALRRFLAERAGGAAGTPEAAAPAARKTVIVRVNALSTPHFEADVAAVAQPGVDLVNLPKPERAADVQAAAAALERAERANGVAAPIGLLLNIESPAALRRAAELAAAHPRVAGLQVGLGDLFEPLGIARRERGAVEQVLFAVRLAAGEAGRYAVDGAFANVADADGYRAEAALARAHGFVGKTCIHPSQIALANAVFRPTDDEIAHALRVLAAAREAASDGRGAFLVDGKMIDPPFIVRAEAIAATARRLGLAPADR